MTWEEFKAEHLKFFALRKRPNTHKRNHAAQAMLEAHCPISLLEEVTPQVLNAIVTERLKEGIKVSTIRREMGSLKSMMRWAQRQGWHSFSDWRLDIPRVPKARPHAHTQAELVRLIDHCHGIWKTLCWLGSRAGLRRSECWAARWDWIDFENNIITVRRSAEWRPKDADERQIPLLPDLKKYLLSIKPESQLPWIVAHGDHRPSLESFSVYFRKLTKQAGLAGSIHTLRHTFLTMMANAGVNIYALQKWAGHSDIKTTLGYIDAGREYENELKKIQPLKISIDKNLFVR